MTDNSCGVCGILVFDGFLCCSGLCGKCYHYNCVGLTKSALQVVIRFNSIHWFCDKCTSITRFRSIEQSINDIKSIVTKIDEKINRSPAAPLLLLSPKCNSIDNLLDFGNFSNFSAASTSHHDALTATSNASTVTSTATSTPITPPSTVPPSTSSNGTTFALTSNSTASTGCVTFTSSSNETSQTVSISTDTTSQGFVGSSNVNATASSNVNVVSSTPTVSTSTVSTSALTSLSSGSVTTSSADSSRISCSVVPPHRNSYIHAARSQNSTTSLSHFTSVIPTISIEDTSDTEDTYIRSSQSNPNTRRLYPNSAPFYPSPLTCGPQTFPSHPAYPTISNSRSRDHVGRLGNGVSRPLSGTRGIAQSNVIRNRNILSTNEPIIGSASNLTGLSASNQNRCLFLSRLDRNTTTEMIVDYFVQYFHIQHGEVSVIKLKGRNNVSYSSFKIYCSEDIVNAALSDRMWPVGVLVREFINLPKNNA